MHGLETTIALNARAARFGTEAEARAYMTAQQIDWDVVPTCAGDWRLVPKTVEPVTQPEGSFEQELLDHIDLYAGLQREGRVLSDLELFALEMARRLIAIRRVPAIWNDRPVYPTRTVR